MSAHTVREDWMGEEVETLEDLLRPGLLAVCIGINPTPTSVAVGHYYQGQNGKRFYERLRRAELLPQDAVRREDDALFAEKVGFTDIVKRPTGKAAELRPEEYAYGRPLLRRKLDRYRPKLLLFSYKETAVKLYGRFGGNGFLPRFATEYSEVFVMPGPYAPTALVDQRVAELRAWWREANSP